MSWKRRGAIGERELVARAVALVDADIRHTTSLDPVIRVVELDDGVIAATYDGSYQAPAVFSIREPESICEVADNLQVHVVDELWTVWPVCPADGLGLDPRVVDGRAVWHCRVGEHIAADIGAL